MKRSYLCVSWLCVAACGGAADLADAATSLDASVDVMVMDAATAAMDVGTDPGDAGLRDAQADVAEDAASIDAALSDAAAFDGGPVVMEPVYTCTQIQGAAQSRSWFIDELFFDFVAPGTWQRLGGTGINHWRNADSPLWDEDLDHPCDEGQSAPDRVVQVVWGHTIFDTDQWERNMVQAMEVTRSKYPTVRTIVLQPVASRPGCEGSYGTLQHERIVDAIDRLVGEGVEAGPLVSIESCDSINQISLDTLNDEAARRVAAEYGAFFVP